MPIFPLGNTLVMDIIVGSALNVGGVQLTRPGVPGGIKVGFPTLRPEVPVPPYPLLDLDSSQVLDADGYTVTIDLENSIAPVFYTLDGSTPTSYETSVCFPYTVPFRVEYPDFPRGSLVTVKAKAFALPDSGFADSALLSLPLIIPL